MSRATVDDLLLALICLLTAGLLVYGVFAFRREIIGTVDEATRTPAPHVQSDCRAACTLEGMELAGVELAPHDQSGRGLTCLCAPVTP